MITSYDEAKQYIDSLIPIDTDKKFPGELGLIRTRELLKVLDNPQDEFESIHVTGTSGKGSTCYFLSNILAHAGYKVGLHISPHLRKITERMQINNKPLEDRKFVKIVSKLLPAVEKFNKDNKYGQATYFEIFVALSFLAFAEENVDIAVVEVGMGGKYDATNVLQPLVAVVTNIGLDHIQVLGNTKKEILKDKMQIIKPDTRAFTGIESRKLLNILEEHCNKSNVKLHKVNSDNYEIVSLRKDGTIFNFYGEKSSYRNLELSLLGAFQVKNASIAIDVTDYLAGRGYRIYESTLRNAMKETNIPGRMEVLRKDPLVVLDGAHNVDKVKALVSSFSRIFPSGKTTVVFAVKKGKDYIRMIGILKNIADNFILTSFTRETDIGLSQSVDPARIEKKIKNKFPNIQIDIIKDSKDAIDYTITSTKESDIILITGSLYLIGEVREYLLEKQATSYPYTRAP